MTTNSSQFPRWSKEALADLPLEGVFRLRGLAATRLETFVDAAFAFVLTLLVISFDEIPSNYDEMMETVRGIPGFLFCFMVLMIFWLSHRNWSRRFGLENKLTVVISLSIIFTILVYVYPLRMMFESAFSYISGGYLSTTFTTTSFAELRGMFTYYSAGFLAMALLYWSLYKVTLRSKDALCLSYEEETVTKDTARAWAVCGALAVTSILLANLLPDERVPFAGWVYALTYPTIEIVNRLAKMRGKPKNA